MNKRRLLPCLTIVFALIVCLSGTALASEQTNGWVDNGNETWSYYIDGVMVSDDVISLGGNYYGFDYNGVMYTDTAFEIYDDEAGRWNYYRAKTGGALYVNEWYEDESGYFYYYGADGCRYGHGVYEIGGNYYSFDYNGVMYTDTAFEIYDDEAGRWNYYRAKTGGALYVNEWYEDESGYFYYYGADGCRYGHGVYEIGGKYYGFDYNGVMYTDTSFDIYDDEVERWVYYRAKDDGSLYVNEWFQYEGESNYKYYYGEGGKAPYGIIEADGALYFCYSDGGVYFGPTTHDMYDSEQDRWLYCRSKTDGTLYAGEWYERYGNKYYYGEDGWAAYDFLYVDNAWYFFGDDGRVFSNRGVYSAVYEGYYALSEDGTASVALSGTGWINAFGDWYYVVDGIPCEGIQEIDGVLYGFMPGSYTMYTDEYGTEYGAFGMYNDELGHYAYYRAKKGGALYVNEWYKDRYGTWYYYGEGGVAPSGFAVVNGVQYYFYDGGRMVTDALVSAEDGYYLIDANGAASKITQTDGWVEAGSGDRYYFMDGAPCTNGVYEIDGAYYMFNYSGVMYVDAVTDFYNDDLGRWVYYRAKADGTLYVNEWYTSYGNKYYYGEGGAAPNGFATVDGVQYFFYSNGSVATNQLVSTGDGYYLIDKNGVATKVTQTDGWVEDSEGYYYYFSNGEPYRGVVKQIGSSYYGFDYNGRMYTDRFEYFGFYNEDLGRSAYYRARANGALYVNEWYTRYGEKYYYGEGGASACDFTLMDGVWYFFDEYGKMVTGQLVYSESYESYYIINENGTGSTAVSGNAGWVSVGDDYYYLSDGELYRGGVYQIDGSYYGFDYNGVMYTDRDGEFDAYNRDLERYDYYRAKANGTLYVNEWYKDQYGNWYYYGEGGAAPSGFTTLNGVKYYFRYNGRMVVDAVVTAEDGYHLIDADGVVTKVTQTNGWLQTGSGYYYIKDGVLCTHGIYEIDGAYYMFDYSGVMYVNAVTDFYNDDLGRWVCYRAKADGTLYVNEWYRDTNGTWYYYGEQGMSPRDFTLIDGTWYFFDDVGRMITGQLVYSESYDAYYTINKAGTGSTVVDDNAGWVNVFGDYYYVKNGQLYSSGVYQIDGSYYGFDYDGVMYTADDGYFGMYNDELDRHVYYRPKASGALYVNEWYKDQYGEWYYYGEGGVAASGLTKIGNVTYLFSSVGYMRYNCITNVDTEQYYVKENGAVVTSAGWYVYDGSYIYVNDGGTLAVGWLQSGGTWYYMEPIMCHDTVFVDPETGDTYYANASGVCTRINENGIIRIESGGSVFVENGVMVTNTWKKIDGSWYYFADSGYMVTGCTYNIDGTYYVFDVNGKMYTDGWLKLDGYNVYADVDGKAYTGVKTIDGVKYVFDFEGWLYTSGTIYADDGKWYVVDENGAVVGDPYVEGWNLIDGVYHYVANGRFLRGETVLIDGKLYGFDYSGAMLKNVVWSWGDLYVFGSDGAALSGWQKMDGNWYYADPETYNAGWYGKKTIDGADYYFSGSLKIGTFVYNNMIITTNSGGAVVSETAIPDGWTYVNGAVLYRENGTPYTGWIGNYYISNGYMQYHDIVEVDGEYYYLQPLGNCLINKWHLFEYRGYEYGYIRAKADGSLCVNEWYKENGSWYYFSDVFMVSDCVIEIDGVYYEFDASGKMVGEVSVEPGVSAVTGWVKDGADWYYFHAGERVTGVWFVDGKWYGFDYDGRMITNALCRDDVSGKIYYFDANGVIASYTGWKTINGNQCYFKEDHSLAAGWFQVGDNVYYGRASEDYDGEYHSLIDGGLRTGYYNDGQYLHYFNSNGVYQGIRGVENGWYQVADDWYYFENGKLIDDNYRVIDGVGYAFSSGRMRTNEVLYRNGAYRYFNANGVEVKGTGWMQTEEGWIYFKPNGDGALYDGIWKIGGVDYCFEAGIMV